MSINSGGGAGGGTRNHYIGVLLVLCGLLVGLLVRDAVPRVRTFRRHADNTDVVVLPLLEEPTAIAHNASEVATDGAGDTSDASATSSRQSHAGPPIALHSHAGVPVLANKGRNGVAAAEADNPAKQLDSWLNEFPPYSGNTSCQNWEGLSDFAAKVASVVVRSDSESIFATLGATKVLFPPQEPRPLPYPNISPFDRYFNASGFYHVSHFRRFRGYLSKVPRRAQFPQWTRHEPAFFVAALHHAVLSWKDFILLCDRPHVGLHLASCLRRGHLDRKKVVSRHALVAPGYVFPSVRFCVPLCMHGWCRWGGPFHFIMEHLTRIAPLVDTIREHEDTFLVTTAPSNDAGHKAMLKLVTLIGVPARKIRHSQPGSHAEYLLYTPVDCFRPQAYALGQLRRLMFLRLELVAPPRPLLVFAERMIGKGSERAPLNYPDIKAAVIALCEARGVDHVTVTDITDTTTIRAFAQASVVVGVHGANLSPVAFMPHGSALVEFLARKSHPLCFYHAAAMINVGYFPVIYDFGHFHAPPPQISVKEVVVQTTRAIEFALNTTRF